MIGLSERRIRYLIVFRRIIILNVSLICMKVRTNENELAFVSKIFYLFKLDLSIDFPYIRGLSLNSICQRVSN